MSNPIEMIQPDAETQARFEKIAQGLKQRHAASRRLKTYGIMAIVTAISFLVILLTTIISNGYTAIQQTELQISLTIPAEKLQNDEGVIDPVKALNFNWNGLIKKSFRAEFPDVTAMLDQRALGEILSKNAGYDLRRQIEAQGAIPAGETKLWRPAPPHHGVPQPPDGPGRSHPRLRWHRESPDRQCVASRPDRGQRDRRW